MTTDPNALPATPWYQGVEGVDAELTGHIQTKGWDKLAPNLAAAAAAKAQREAEKLIGAAPDKIIRLPNDPKDEAGMRAVYERLGAPKEAKDYDFSAIKKSDGTPADQAMLDLVRAQAHTLGISKDAAARLAETMVKDQETRATAAKAEYDGKLVTERAELDKNWGTNKEANMFIAKRAATALGVTADDVAALEKVVGYKRVMDMFLAVGQKIGEDKFIANPAPGGSGVMTVEQAVARKGELMDDKAWQKRYFDGGSAEKNEMAGLMALIAGAKGR
jgi:hypothetical protein